MNGSTSQVNQTTNARSNAITIAPAASRRPSPVTHTRYSIHGVPSSIRSYVPSLASAIARQLAEFGVESFPEGSPTSIDGTLRRYEQSEVAKYLSPDATPVPSPRDGMEVYQDGERFWMIDDRWGLCELNLLKGHWRSWILPEPAVDADRVVEQAIVWPMAQLLRARGLCLLPAVSVARGEPESTNYLGLLIVAPFSVEPEIASLIRAGFRVVGQRWTALRDDNGAISAVRFPGRVERNQLPRMRPASNGQEEMSSAITSMLAPSHVALPQTSAWVDLESEYCGCAIPKAQIDTVMLIEPGRRPTACCRAISPSGALPALRQAWPILELHPQRVGGQFPVKLSRRCKTYAMRLSHRPQDFLDTFEAYRAAEQRERTENAAIHATTRMIETLAG